MSVKFEVHTFGSLYLGDAAQDILPADLLDYPEETAIEIGNTVEGAEITWLHIPEMGIFVTDHAILTNVNWDDLHKAGFISGKTVCIDGHLYRCRVPKMGRGINKANEWGRILHILAGFTCALGKNCTYAWGQENSIKIPSKRVVCNAYSKTVCEPNRKSPYIGFWPILEPLCEKKTTDNKRISIREAITSLEIMATNLTGEISEMSGDRADYYIRTVDALDMAIESLRKWHGETKPSWIPIDEKEPEDGKRVLFWLGKLNVYGDQSPKYALDSIRSDEVQVWKDTATHWMRMPEPPMM